ncbi:MAG: TIGR03560 family F420-dependent LLM class oxidoreductase [Actinobacteria bacterium]|nr:TIGR03560 family F420-dependent LLM class oxidoreductase [Actinomycetota bacterium]
MRICLMIEGQEGVTWDDWMALAAATEDSGLEGLFRSDHYLSIGGEGRSSLDAWTTLAGLAVRTERIQLGTMVSPTTFRHPAVLAKSVVTVDHISNGRAELGIGAGWYEDEHRAYGFPFADTKTRMAVLEEQIEIVAKSWREGPFDLRGEHYTIEDLDALPKPVSKPRPNLIVGGSGGPRSIELCARWADEYNTVSPTLDEIKSRRKLLERAWESAGRDPGDLVFSAMTGGVVGSDQNEVRARARALMDQNGESGSEDDWLERARRTQVIGTVDEAVDRIRTLSEAGLDRIMLQHLMHTDVEMVAVLGEVVDQL